MLFKELKSSSLMAAAAWGAKARPDAHPAVAAPKMRECIFMGDSLRSVAGIFLQIFQNRLGLRCGNVGAHPHVGHERLPLCRRPFSGIALGMAAVAIDLV